MSNNNNNPEKTLPTDNKTETTEKPLSKKQLAKKAKEEKKERERKEREEKERQARLDLLEKFKDVLGYREIAESPITEKNPKREYFNMKNLGSKSIGQDIWLRGRISGKKAKSSKLCFLNLRNKYYTVQCVVSDNGNPVELVKFCSKISNESVVDIYGTVVKAEVEVTGASFSDIEINVRKCYIVSEAIPQLPLQIEDASRPNSVLENQQKEINEIEKTITEVKKQLDNAGNDEEKAKLNKQLEELADLKSRANKYAHVDQSVKLDYRVIDLRTPANHAIYTISTGFCSVFREKLVNNGFIEIHSPKLLGAASEGGASVFEVKYFDRKAYLAQSPQLFKQMAIVGDFGKVFEIGPVFRAEKSDTHRHLTEFTGIDLEMEFNQHYHEVLFFIGKLLIDIFNEMEKRYDEELKVINEQYPFERIVYSQEPLVLNFSDAVQLIRENGGIQQDLEDLNTENERLLGRLVKQKYNTDFYILDKFPFDARAFYTMRDPQNPNYGNAYDIFLRGEEISSGAQRVHVSELLEQQAKARGIDTVTIKDYVDSFKYGANPHAGCGLGLERIVSFYLNLGNVRKTSLFPRDMYRLSP